jgi:hypothetical protein
MGSNGSTADGRAGTSWAAFPGPSFAHSLGFGGTSVLWSALNDESRIPPSISWIALRRRFPCRFPNSSCSRQGVHHHRSPSKAVAGRLVSPSRAAPRTAPGAQSVSKGLPPDSQIAKLSRYTGWWVSQREMARPIPLPPRKMGRRQSGNPPRRECTLMSPCSH